MPVIQWSDDFSTHNDKIDEQHKRWIEIYNQAHDKMMGTIPVENKTQIGAEALDEMIAYTRYHFKTEEAIMESISYPDIETHKNIHQAFSDKLKQTRKNIEDGTWVLNSEIIKTIENWFIDHILSEDQKIFKS